MGYELMELSREDGVAKAVISAPPCNVMTVDLWVELDRLSQEIEADKDVRVLILKSPDPQSRPRRNGR